MSDALELADQLWRGEREITDHHPFSPSNSITEAADGVAFVDSLANVTAFATDDGLAMVDTGSVFMARTLHETIRTWNGAPLRAAVYSHGHIDHVFGVPVFEEEARANGWPEPKVVAHEALPARFDRYVMTAGYNAVINQRQFQAPGLRWPTEYRYPDETYRERHHVEVGGLGLHLHHAKGETDDHTWTWVPDRSILCCGDLFIWCSPNAGNPQKVQRYPREWAVALREMADLGAEVMLPGHGLPVAGSDRVRTALLDTAALLESLLEQTLGMMNEGARLDDVLHSVRAPADLLDKPYLRPIYDEPEFVVRNIWRLYGGWYDGNPARLKPAPDARLAGELAAAVGGSERLAGRARELAEAGDEPSLRLACHLVELAVQAAPDDPAAHAARAEVYERRLAVETSMMARGVFTSAATDSRRRAQGDSSSPA